MTEKNLQILSPEQRFDFVAQPGSTIRDLLNQLPNWEQHESLAVFNHGLQIKDIDSFIVNEGDSLVVCLMPMGGSGNGKAVAMIVVGIALIATAWYLPTGWAVMGGAITKGTLFAMGASMLLGGVGTMLAPKPNLGTNNFGSSERENSYFITGQSNQSRPYQPVLVAYGRNKIYPLIAANPNIINVGKESTFDVLYDFGIGEQQFNAADIHFGDTPASQFNPQYFLHTNTQNPNLNLITNRYGYQDFQVKLEKDVSFIATTKSETISAEVNIAFQQGLYTLDNNGNPQSTSVDMRVEWRAVGSTTWNFVGAQNFYGANVAIKTQMVTGARVAGENQVFNAAPGTQIAYGADSRWAYATVDGSGEMYCSNSTFGDPAYGTAKACYLRQAVETSAVTISGATTAPFIVLASIFFPTPGDYEIRLTRLSAISTDTRTSNTAHFTLLESRVAGNVLNLTAPHTMLEMRVKATDRLNGVVQNLSVISTSVLNTYDANGNMVGRVATRNPAWIAIDIMTGFANPRPIRHDQIDWPAWKALADICDSQRTWNVNGQTITSNRFYCDTVIDYNSTIKELLESVLSTCRSSLTIGLNGRYSVMFDGARTIPRQLITPSNSWDFTATRQFPADIHALRVSFIDEQSDYKKQEIIVYRDGYNYNNTTKFEDVGTIGITTFQHAWAFGRYQLAAAIMRSEVFTVTMDVENLACQRGDLVQVSHDVPMIGGQPAHIVSVSGNTITITEDISGSPTHYVHRSADGIIRQGLIATQIDEQTFTMPDTTNMGVDDLIVLGHADSVTESYIVSQISPSTDLTAALTLLPYAPAVYDADIGELPEWNPEFSEDLINATDLSIIQISASNQQLINVDSKAYGKFDIAWTANKPNMAATYDLLIETADGSIETITGLTDTKYSWQTDLTSNPLIYGPVKFTVIPYTSSGLAGTSGTATSTISQVDFKVTMVTASQQVNSIINQEAYGNFHITWEVNDPLLVVYDLVILTADGRSLTIPGLTSKSYDYQVSLDEYWKYGPIYFSVVPYTASGIKGRDATAVSEVKPIDLAVAWVSSTAQTISYVERMPIGSFNITWDINYPDLYAYYDLVITTADNKVTTIKNIAGKSYTYEADLTNKLIYGNVTFTVIPYTYRAVAGLSGSTTALIYREQTRPAPVNWFLVNVQDMNIALSWEPPQEPDIASYEIRYSPKVEGAIWNASQSLGIFAHNVTRTMVGARTGTYMICVRDTSDNLSDMYYRRTTIEELPNINLIETINDYPNWQGTGSGTEVVGNKVQLAGEFGYVFPDGIYYYDSIFDAGQIYELRIVSKIQSHGTTKGDYMVNWTPLASAIPIAKAESSQYSAMLEVRTADEVEFMVNWEPLASAVPIQGAGGKGWSAWRPCEVGDFTGRLFQFRLRLQSFDANVRTVIDDGLVEIDVRDRIDRYSNLAVPSTGLTVNFDPAFMDVPTLAITTENSVATSKQVTNKSRTAFTVQLFNEAGQAVSGQIDVLALGYGRERPTSI